MGRPGRAVSSDVGDRGFGVGVGDAPLVSIGLPVYNGERYLRIALESVLAQTYANLELVISDNASTDGTEAICREYAERDPRVRYHRADRNRGAVWNFNRAFELARGEFFMWQAFDDARAPECVARCAAELAAHPDAVLCCTDVLPIDAAGHAVAEAARPRAFRPVGATPEARLRALARSRYWYDFYGMTRASALRRTRLCRPVWGFDVVLLFELCLLGPVVHVPAALFHYRLFSEKSGADAAATLGAQAGAARIPLSWTEFSLEMLRATGAAPLPAARRWRLAAQFLREWVLGNPVVAGSLGGRDVWQAAGRALGAGGPRALAGVLLFGAGALPPVVARRTVRRVGGRVVRAIRRGAGRPQVAA